MKKFLFLMLFAILFSTNAYPQERKEAIVKLKSGIEVRGEIIDQVAGEQVTLKTAEGDLFVYTMDDIVRIEDPNAAAAKQKAKEEQHQAKIDARIAAKDAAKQKREERALGNFKGYRGIFELTYTKDLTMRFGDLSYVMNKNSGGWRDKNDSNCISASFINGYNCGPKFFIGVGVGCQYNWGWDDLYVDRRYCSFDWREINIPVFLHLRSAFTKNRRVSPYFSINLGYIFNIYTKCSGYEEWLSTQPASSGIYAEPSFGIELRCKQKTAVFFAFTAPIVFRTDVSNINGEIPISWKFIVPIGAKFGFSF